MGRASALRLLIELAAATPPQLDHSGDGVVELTPTTITSTISAYDVPPQAG